MMTKVKKILGSKAFYIVFSILSSITIWMYVEYVENPDMFVTLRGIKVELLNQDYLTDRGLVVTEINPDSVSARFTGKREIISQLTNANITVTADLSEIKTTGIYPLRYTFNFPIEASITPPQVSNKSVDFIAVTVDDLSKKDIPLRGTFAGSVSDGYQAEPIELTPSVLTVSGPQSVLSKISYAWVSVDRDNISKTIDENLPFTLMDDSGHEVVSDKLTFSQDTVKVKIPVVMVKDVPLTVNLTPGAGADETNTVWTVTPSSISLSGDAETLGSLNQITLGTIDLSQFLTTTDQTFKIALPNGTTNLTGITEATVHVAVSGLDSRHFSATNIKVTNVPAGYTATVLTTSADILLRGKTVALNSIAPENIRVEADLSDLGTTTGYRSFLAKVTIDGDIKDVGAVGEYKVVVNITKDMQ
jgi:YbbR domain-containing protein